MFLFRVNPPTAHLTAQKRPINGLFLLFLRGWENGPAARHGSRSARSDVGSSDVRLRVGCRFPMVSRVVLSRDVQGLGSE